jgi:hypothetical protein
VVGGASLPDGASPGALVPEASAAGDVFWARVFGSGASLAHRPEKRQQMDLIKLMGSTS